MEPSDEVLTRAVDNSPEGWALIAFCIVAVLFVLVKWGLPVIKELRERKLDNDRFRIEVDERAATALDDRERERIRNTAALVEQQRQNNENTKALVTIMTGFKERVEESAARSKGMGGKVDAIDATTRHTDTLVEDIHRHLVGGEGTD